MPQLVRKLNVSKWLEVKDIPLVNEQDFPAEQVVTLGTKIEYNDLSVWEIDDERRLLPDALLAASSGKEKLEHAGYAVIDKSVVERNGFDLEEIAGNSALRETNQFHRNIKNLTGIRLTHLTRLFYTVGYIDTLPEKILLARLDEIDVAGGLDAAKLKPKQKAQLDFFRSKK